MFARALVFSVLVVALVFSPAPAEEAILLPMPTPVTPKILPAVTTTTTSSTPCAAAKPESCAFECPERLCAPACQERITTPTQRIKVIVPPPEVVFRYAQPSCKSGHHDNKGAYCVSAPCASPGGEMKFNMNFNGNGGMSAMVPMVAGAGFGGFGGMGLPFGGFPMGGAGFGAGPFGAAGAGSTGMEALLMRALLAQSREAPNADAEMEARINRLTSRIEEQMTAMQSEQKKDLTLLIGVLTEIKNKLLEKK